MSTESNNIIDKVRRDIEGRNEVIKLLYTDRDLAKAVRNYIMSNGGNDQDANDMFTFGIMAFIKQCYKPLFDLTRTVEAYIFSIVKYEWMRQHKRKMQVVSEEKIPEGLIIHSFEDEIFERERKEALSKALEHLDDKCEKVLTLWASSLKMREIAIRMEYKSEGMARKKKHECLAKLKLLIKDI